MRSWIFIGIYLSSRFNPPGCNTIKSRIVIPLGIGILKLTPMKKGATSFFKLQYKDTIITEVYANAEISFSIPPEMTASLRIQMLLIHGVPGRASQRKSTAGITIAARFGPQVFSGTKKPRPLQLAREESIWQTNTRMSQKVRK